ncbi:MAG: hypothetical protein LBU91_03140 [Bacteroidales bacterium]|jgi:hypothetical protein|nr:hypothetical protein [Bacteroidales bacterium]
MNKTLKIALNILIFLLIAGFGYYMVKSMMSKKETVSSNEESTESTFISPYKKTTNFDATSEIKCFYAYENVLYLALADKISVFDLSGKHQRDFAINADVCDMMVNDATVYVLYPTRLDLYTLDGQKKGGWEACSDNSDYCAFTATKDYIFVTDAANKNIVQYDKQGALVRFIKSPEGFVIPSYSFDIISINDTVYCANSGMHKIESYTLDGEFIASFGEAGTGAGAFAGCCNPAFLEKIPSSHILTSEKGSPRISSYGKDGKFRTILFDGNMLNSGTTACEMHVSGQSIYIANGPTISVYTLDTNCLEQSCAGCKVECPLRK